MYYVRSICEYAHCCSFCKYTSRIRLYFLTGANHLVPMELALKIASKIHSNERFSVYIVIPMWPEGVPTSAAVQEILFWQVRPISSLFIIVIFGITNMIEECLLLQPLYLNFE